MASFPAAPLPIVQQIMIGGVWTDVTSRTRGAGGLGGVTVTRGYSGEQVQLAAGTSAFTINNRDGLFTNDNPNSINYRLLGRNTPYRNGLDSGAVSARFLGNHGAGTGDYDGSVVWTADKASLDIVGDVDIAVDFETAMPLTRDVILASKYVLTSNQRSWVLGMTRGGRVVLYWSTDGTVATRVTALSPVITDLTVGRVQLRVQLDVNNGTGGWTASFYQGTGANIGGPYTLMGSVSGTGVTSIFNSTARLELGDANVGATYDKALGDSDPFVGKFYSMQLRNGLAGTVVANAGAYLQAAGTTSWSDGLTSPNTWTVTGSTTLESLDFRFYGEIPSLPNRWDTSGTDIYIPIIANDIVSRATTGNFAKPVKSPVFQNLSQFPWDGYWPLEQPFDSTVISAYIGRTGRKTAADFSVQPTDFAGTAGSLLFNDDTGFATATANSTTGSPTLGIYLFYFKMDTPTASSQTVNQFFVTGGTASRISFSVSTTVFGLQIAAADGTLLVNSTSLFGGTNDPSNWTAMRLKLSSSGGTVTYEWAWYQLNQPDTWGTSGTYSGTVGRPYYWSSPAFTGKFGLQLAHIAMGRFDLDFVSADFLESSNAYARERWDDRVRRIGALANLPTFVEGSLVAQSADNVYLMGPQGLKTPVALLQECADVAGGMLYAPRDKPGLAVRSWELLARLTPATLDYAAAHLSGSLQPEPDLFLILNDLTLQTPDGSTYRYVKTTGTLNVNDPATDPDAVGTYDQGPVPINLAQPDDMPKFAQRDVFQGTWDEARYPQVQVQLERAPFVASAALTAAMRKLDLARPFQIVNPPAWLPPGAIGLMIVGYVETMGGMTQTINFNTVPSGPYTAGVWGSTTTPATPTATKWGARVTTLKTGVNATATSLVFTTPDKFERWSTAASGYHVKLAGEIMTVSAVTGPTGSGPFDYAITVIRSVNGVSKAQLATAPVVLVEQGRWA